MHVEIPHLASEVSAGHVDVSIAFAGVFDPRGGSQSARHAERHDRRLCSVRSIGMRTRRAPYGPFTGVGGIRASRFVVVGQIYRSKVPLWFLRPFFSRRFPANGDNRNSHANAPASDHCAGVGFGMSNYWTPESK
jgi:hypothetical protein